MYAGKATLFGYLGVLFFITTTIIGGILTPGYSHISQLISEMYAMETPYGFQLRNFGFLPSGICIAVFAYYAYKALPASAMAKLGFSGIGIFYGIATVIVSLFPCDKDCNKELVDPSLSQVIHNLTGLLTYLIVPLCVLVLGLAARKWEKGKLVSNMGIVCGLTAILFVSIISSDMYAKVVGLYQRIIEGSLLLWIIICADYAGSLHKMR